MNKIAMVGTLGALLNAGAIHGDRYMEALGAFATDLEPYVVSAVISELDSVRDTFVTDNLTDEFAIYLQKNLSPAIEHFGIKARPGEDEAVAGSRPRLLYWLGVIAEDETVVSWASEAVTRYIHDPSSIDPELAGVAVKIKAKKGDEALFDQFVAAFEAADSPVARGIYLGALGGFEDPGIRKKALAYTLEGPIRPNEMFKISNEIRTTSIGADLVFDWLLTHYDVITRRIPPIWLPFMPLAGNGCDQDRMERARVFFANPAVKVDGTDKQMARVEASVMDCVGLRTREGGKVQSYLQGL